MAMESSEVLGILGILRESIKILTRNGKLMLSITLLTLLSYTLVVLGIIYSLRPFLLDLLLKALDLAQTDPRSPEYIKLLVGIKRDFSLLIGVGLLFLLLSFVVSLFSRMTTIYVIAVTYLGKYLSFKELFSRIVKTWKRQSITWFYVILLSVGYSTLLLPALMASVLLIANGLVALAAVGIVFVLMAVSLHLYLAIVWVLGFVISVAESSLYGMKALREAEELSKGRKLLGFVINLIFMLLICAISLGLQITKNQRYKIRLFIVLVKLFIFCLIEIFWSVVYTVFYFECKKSHGDEIDIEGLMGYGSVSTSLVGPDLS